MNPNIMNTATSNFMNVITSYVTALSENPMRLILFFVDISIVILLFVKLVKIVKDSRAWQLLKGISFQQLLKGISFLIIAMALSSVLHLSILNYILTSFITYGTVFVVLFQPELRRSFEELGSNKLTRFFRHR